MKNFLVDSFIEGLPDVFIRSQGEKYLAGHSLEEGISFMKQIWSERRIMTTGDILGEEAKNFEEAERYFNGYLEMINSLKGEAKKYFDDKNFRRPFSISVKPSSICFINFMNPLAFHSETPFFERLEKIVDIGEKENIPVTVDMEDHNFTDSTLETASKVWECGHKNFGIVLQSRLNRTENDIKRLFSKDKFDPIYKRVRVCIGIYQEPNLIASNKKEEAKRRMKKRVEELFDCGAYVEIATHDFSVIEDCIKLIEKKKIPEWQYEFQMLKGPNIVDKNAGYLFRKNKSIRLYAPFELKEGDGIPYQRRRLKNNPDIIKSAIRDKFFGKFEF